MAHNKLYRNFIILQEDEKINGASGDKALSGYAKIEAKSDKCKISFYAQNLKKDDTYSIVLICYKKELKQIVDLGSLDVNEVGKGESSKEYYINDIAGLDFSYEKISGAAICKHKDGELIFLMYGFMNGENVGDTWKKCKIIKCIEKNTELLEKEVKKLDKEVKKEEEKLEKKYKKEEKLEKEANKEEKKLEKENKNEDKECKKKEDKAEKDDCKKELAKEEKKEESKCKENKNKDCMGMCRNQDGINFDEYESNIEKEIDPFDFQMRGSIGEFFENIVKDFDEVKNRFKEIKYCKWYDVKVNDLDDMCNISNYNKYTIAYYPMLNYYPYIRKYGHFLLGYKCDSNGELKYIVYGVPGTKDKDEQPYAGKTGFVTWMSTGKDKEGCWLMFYDYKNSNVVVPMK